MTDDATGALGFTNDLLLLTAGNSRYSSFNDRSNFRNDRTCVIGAVGVVGVLTLLHVRDRQVLLSTTLLTAKVKVDRLYFPPPSALLVPTCA